ncbi:hypothetical protein BMS3Bbin02_00971 [bacterium BMS3Bbin02]|nr:hypothetical protein BMS3Bbin02_00971 [bacterium BMS3Bbin02]
MSVNKRALLIIGIVVGLMIPVMATAADRFTDVPDTNNFHDDIGWLADAGVTLGCNPPANDEFCPTENVTREQMAAFMHRFAKYLGAEDGIVSEADTVDGFNAGDLIRGAGSATWVNTSNSPAQADVFTVAAPVDGGIVTTLSFNCTSFSGTTNTRWDVTITVDSVIQSSVGAGVLYFNHAESASVFSSATTSFFSAVTAGNHDVGYNAVQRAGDGSLDCDISETAVFVPFGGDGSTPAVLVPENTTRGTEK